MLSDGWSKAFQNFSVKCVDTLKSLQKEIARLNRFIAKHLYDKGPNGSWFWILSNVYKICHNFYPNNLWNFEEKRKKLRRKIWEISSFIFRSALLTFVKVITSKKPKKNFIYFSPCYRNVIITVYTQYGWFLLRERERRDKLILSMDKNLLTLCKSNIIFLNPCLSSLDKLETSPTDKNQVLYSNKK